MVVVEVKVTDSFLYNKGWAEGQNGGKAERFWGGGYLDTFRK